MTTPEGKIKAKVKKILAHYNCYYFMPVQTGYGATSLDFLLCIRGVFVAIETKAPGKKMTARQEVVADQMRLAGAAVLLVRSDDDLAALVLVLEQITGRKYEEGRTEEGNV